jgi:di/tricarboxylate transporter
MTWEIALVCVLMVGALTSFVAEKVSTDVTALTVFAGLLLFAVLPFDHTLPRLNDLLLVFANPAPVTIGALFVLSAALEKSGAIDGVAYALEKLTRYGYAVVLVFMVLMVATISAFINNTPVVVVFLPVVLHLARKLDVSASKLLIPLSYASIFGGVCTLVGTSTNILASSLIEKAGLPPIRMFELTKVGVPLLGFGLLYLLLFGRRLLPDRASLTSILSEEERREYLTEAFVPANSQLVGKTLLESGLLKSRGVRVLEIIRREVALRGDLKNTTLESSDRLILSCRPSGFVHANALDGIKLAVEEREGLETISAHEGSIVEGVIGPRSDLVGRALRDINFRQRFRMIVLAVHRRGRNMRESIESLTFEQGDILLMMGTDQALEHMRRSDDIFLLDRPATPTRDFRSKAPIVVGTFLTLIGLISFDVIPIAAGAIIAVVALFLTRCITPKEGYAAVDWSILMLIYGMLGLGLAMESTGAITLIAGNLVALTEFGLPQYAKIMLLLACIYLVTTVLTEILSNNATVVLMVPLCISLGTTLGFDPRALIIAVCVASSASFATPIGYQTNTYVYGVGGYKFADFLKIGIPLNTLYFVGTVIIVPLFWNF